VTVRTYRRLLEEAAGVSPADLRAHGSALAGRLGDRWPELVDELDGIAAGAGQDARELVAINARTELLAGWGRGECSVVGHVDDTTVSLAQTWDWHPDLAPARVLWTVMLPDGGWFTTATEAGLLAKLGVNRHGVACGLNFLSCSADEGTDGVPIHVLARLVLERAATAADALSLLLGARTSASSAITIASAAGGERELFAVECSPGGGAVVRPDADGWLVHSNHFLRPPADGVDLEPDAGPGSALRLEHLRRLVGAGVAPVDALASHAPREEPVCRHHDVDADGPWADRRATLLALAIDPQVPALQLAAGTPCTAPFEPVPLP
jgi:isopenicillin-N N-acyltransferase-like protein